MSRAVETVAGFYRAFRQRDHETMARCYHPMVHFSDPVFPELHGLEAAAMWHMLCERGTDLDVSFDRVCAGDDGRVLAAWEARYTFGPKRRRVHNRVDTAFEFEDGLIVRHIDDFDLWRWTRMALGLPGVLTGWTPMTQSQVRKRAARSLDRFVERNPGYRREEPAG